MKAFACIALSCLLVLAGCSVAWVATLDNILAAAAPALNNVITIVDLSQGKPVDQALETKITNDAANLKVLAANFAAASGTNPTACQEVQAGVAVLNDDAAVVLNLVQSVASTNPNLPIIFASADALVAAITGLIPACQTPAAITASKNSVPSKVAKIDVNAMIKNYNKNLTKKTGNAVIDAYTKANQVHVHSSFVRFVSFQKLQ